jgi:hypothetical protein
LSLALVDSVCPDPFNTSRWPNDVQAETGDQATTVAQMAIAEKMARRPPAARSDVPARTGVQASAAPVKIAATTVSNALAGNR